MIVAEEAVKPANPVAGQVETTPEPPAPRRRGVTMHGVHKWAGLVAALWIAVLGVTGFLLDHRDWRWIWQTPVPEILLPESLLEESARAGFTVYMVSPVDPRVRISAGKRGFWTDQGNGWSPSTFDGMEGAPQVFAVLPDQKAGWARLFAATDNGIYISQNGGKRFTPFALAGEFINSAAPGSDEKEIIAVSDRSRVYVLDTDAVEARRLSLSPAGPSTAAPKIGLSRFVRDLHYGRGIVSGLGSLLINDLGGILMLALAVTGFLFWLAPRRWRAGEGSADHDKRMAHRRTMKILHRSHGLYMGVLAVIPVIYLAATGIIIDHSDALMKYLKKIDLNAAYLPPVYNLDSWDGEIYSVMGYAGQPGKISIGARSGLYTSLDGGASWARENLPVKSSCFVWSLSRIAGGTLLGGMGCPNFFMDGTGQWIPLKGSGHMPVSAAPYPGGKVSLLTHGKLAVGAIGQDFEKFKIDLPKHENPPLFILVEGLHNGLIIHPQWVWVNDAVSLAAIILCVTGLVRIYRFRRVVARDFQAGGGAKQ